MKFNCDICNYVSRDKFNYNKHLTTKKHLEKVNHTTFESYNMKMEQTESIEQKCTEKVIQLLNDSNKTPIRLLDEIANGRFKCQYCDNFYASAANLARHKKICENKSKLDNEYNVKIKQLTDQLNQKDDTINILKNENTYLKSIVNNTGSIIKTSVSTMAYVINS